VPARETPQRAGLDHEQRAQELHVGVRGEEVGQRLHVLATVLALVVDPVAGAGDADDLHVGVADGQALGVVGGEGRAHEVGGEQEDGHRHLRGGVGRGERRAVDRALEDAGVHAQQASARAGGTSSHSAPAVGPAASSAAASSTLRPCAFQRSTAARMVPKIGTAALSSCSAGSPM
jgi:hypothetical protein